MGVEVITIKEGDGKTFPRTGDTVIVHYTGCVRRGSRILAAP